MFNHTGDSVILTHMSEHAIRIIDVPSLALRENLAAHVGGCVAAALDPRGRYLASGGFDSIVNLFDTSEWIAARTITVCECVSYCSLLCVISWLTTLVQTGHLGLELLARRRVPRHCRRRKLHRHRTPYSSSFFL
jgi:WD40 repeat protein